MYKINLPPQTAANISSHPVQDCLFFPPKKMVDNLVKKDFLGKAKVHTVKPLFFFLREYILRGRPPCKIPRGPMFAVRAFFYYNHTILAIFRGSDFRGFSKNREIREK